MSKNKIKVIICGLLMITIQISYGQERDRNKIPDQYKWNLTDIYITDELWMEKKKALLEKIPSIEKFKGTLSQSSQQLASCLQLISELQKEYGRLYSYSSMISDQDTRVSKYLSMQSEIQQVGTVFGSATSFVEPEILKMDKAKIDKYLAENKELTVYRKYLFDIIRRKAHTGTEREEKIIAAAGDITSTPGDIYNVFSNADFPFPDITLTTGKTIKLDKAAFALQRATSIREDRKNIFKTYYTRVNEYERTFGAELYAEVKKNIFYSKVRKYSSSLESALYLNNIPIEVYKGLVDNVNKNLSTFHRYLNLRKKILNVDTLHYYDLYAPLTKDADTKYPIEDAQKNIIAALAPLGKDYTTIVSKALNERWIDLYPSDGKRSGAYSNGAAYDVHPYILMNYNGRYDDMRTLAHELGHTMQSYLSNKAQPFPLADYPIFVAEVASTFNEALLIDYMLKNIKDDKAKLALLGNYVEGLRATVFRQTQFAEFELRIHEVAEKGEALTGEKLSELYAEITKKYYGHDKGVCIVDDEVAVEWATVPHFYYNFYVFQYATSFTASSALSEKALKGDKEAIKKYLKFLSSGGSQYPIDLLKEAGVDMTTSQPFDLTIQKMNRIMDEMEKILGK